MFGKSNVFQIIVDNPSDDDGRDIHYLCAKVRKMYLQHSFMPGQQIEFQEAKNCDKLASCIYEISLYCTALSYNIPQQLTTTARFILITVYFRL